MLPGWGFEQAYALSCDGPCDVGRAVSLDIVVAAFEHGTAPVVRAVAASLPAHVSPVRAFLYYKKGIDATDVSHVRAIKRVAAVEAVSLPNVGRCDHAYATHAMRHHNDLADTTLFLKDTTPWHVHLGSMVNVLGLTRALPANLEAFCARSPIDETPAFEPVPGSGLSIFTGKTQTFARRGRDNLPPNLDTAHWLSAPGPGQELVRLNTGKLGGLGVRGKRISGRDLVAMGHMKCGQPPDVRDCRPDDVAARLHTECAGWNEKDPLKRFTDEHRAPVLNEVIDSGVHICTKKGSDEIIRAAARRRRLLGLVN